MCACDVVTSRNHINRFTGDDHTGVKGDNVTCSSFNEPHNSNGLAHSSPQLDDDVTLIDRCNHVHLCRNLGRTRTVHGQDSSVLIWADSILPDMGWQVTAPR